jgi:hypothetical protein
MCTESQYSFQGQRVASEEKFELKNLRYLSNCYENVGLNFVLWKQPWNRSVSFTMNESKT